MPLQSNAGGGGGVNPHDPAPSWQAAAHVGGGHRGVPDVAAAADPDSGWITRTYGGWEAAGGTSAAAPVWAASMLLTQQYAATQGVTQLGPLGPVLYEVAGQQPSVFHDVIKGGNLLYQATPGWDYATGLGTPRVAPLAQAIVNILKK